MKDLDFDVAVVGAGFAGLYLLHRLRGLGFTARAFEAASDVGGTWYWNRYPGARCDVESMQYSFQFDAALQQDWTWLERYASQPEILAYARHVADRFDLRRDIVFECPIAAARYDEDDACWTLRAKDGTTLSARFCVLATGCLSVPNWPRIEGLECFAGPAHHTARWPHEGLDVSGKRVAVIGTGSSAIQSIPPIAKEAARVTVFQRTPNYAIPARNGPLDPEYVASIKADYAALRARARTTHPAIDADFRRDLAVEATPAERAAAFERRWAIGGLTFLGCYGDLLLDKAANDSAADFVRDKIRATVKDPEVAEKLCPKNVIGAKRLCVDTDYYETYNRDNVTLVDVGDPPIEAIVPEGVRAHGRLFPADILVIATGFDAMTGALTRIDIRGRGDASLRDRWAAGPSSYLGLAMADFPNLFTVTGPGSPSVFTNMIVSIEQHVDWIADCLAHMRSHDRRTVEADPEAQALWWDHVQEVAHRGLKAAADSWYLGANVAGKARVFMPYHGGFPQYCRECEEVAAAGYRGFAFE